LNNLGIGLRDMHDLLGSRRLQEESLALCRQVGDTWAVANALSCLAEVALELQDWAAVRTFLHESLQLNLDLEDRHAVAFNLERWARRVTESPAGGYGAGRRSVRRSSNRGCLFPIKTIGYLSAPARAT
jgi:hypothetical protein